MCPTVGARVGRGPGLWVGSQNFRTCMGQVVSWTVAISKENVEWWAGLGRVRIVIMGWIGLGHFGNGSVQENWTHVQLWLVVPLIFLSSWITHCGPHVSNYNSGPSLFLFKTFFLTPLVQQSMVSCVWSTLGPPAAVTSMYTYMHDETFIYL